MSTKAQQSINSTVARNLATTTKTQPQTISITPRLLLKLLPWVQVSSGTYRVNRTKVITKSTGSVNISFQNGRAIVSADDLRGIPLFAGLEGDVLSRISSSFKVEEAEIGKAVVTQGDERDKLYIVANGKVEVLRKGQQGEELQLRLLSSGNYFGDKDLLNNNPSSVTVRALSSSVLLTLSLKELNGLFKEIPSLQAQLQATIEDIARAKASANQFGEKKIELISHHDETEDLPETYVDYEVEPIEYSLSTIQTVLRVSTRVSDIYNDPFNQLEQQIRLTVEEIKERQEWEIINNKDFGLLNVTVPSQRISTRYGAPTPDDLDELLTKVWKNPAFFLAHPKAIAAFERECTWRGVPPVTIQLFGTPVLLWRGVPIIPTDKLEINGRSNVEQGSGLTSIILVRVGEKEQGVVGLHQPGIPGEIAPSLSTRLMGIDQQAIANYLLTLYHSAAVLTDDAIAVLENVEIGYFHDYQHRNSLPK